jgi:uncharacterized protein (TIGR03435 family)
MTRRSSFCLTAVAAAAAVYATPQADSRPAAFDAASIKPAAIPVAREGGNRSRIEHTPVSLSMWNVSVRDCVQWAYGLASYQVPEQHWSSDTYDILAKTAAPATAGQLRMMLRDLLARRFKVAIHRESRMLPVYELVVAKGGPHLPPANASSGPAVHLAESLPRVRNDSFLFSDASMAEFAQMFGQLRGIELPVVDRTGITGYYDIVLKNAPAIARDGDVSELFALVQEQLGLKLVAAKAPIEVVVIDHAEKPSEN